MWTATYKNVDKSGLQPELSVNVEYTNGTNVYTRVYTVMPVDFNSDGFNQVVQSQIDILNAKDTITASTITAVLNKSVATPLISKIV